MSNDVISNLNATLGVFGDLRPVLMRGVSSAGLAENAQVNDLGEVVTGAGGGYHYGKVLTEVGGTIKSVAFAPEDAVRRVTIGAFPSGGTATTVGRGLLGVVFDAPSLAVATEWFADATVDSQSATDNQVFFIPANEEREFSFAGNLTSVYVKRVYGNESFYVVINAAAQEPG
jgi:hypothetical protein